MDEKHRQYCIRLGNPYMMKDEPYNKPINQEERLDNNWNDEVISNEIQDDNWLKNSKKFTN